MLFRALRYLNIPFVTCRSRDLYHGLLQSRQPSSLIVPGGFASAKAKSLGNKGCREISEFINRGGTYIGFCGGAGLALDNDPVSSLGLCSWKRKPASERLPNCSGNIKVCASSDAAYFPEALNTPVSVPIWWPSQFQAENSDNIHIIARYKEPDSDFWVGDLPLSCTDKPALREWEKLYNINLDPDMLLDEPCMISGSFGQGNFLLTYLHLESPNSPAANAWLCNIFSELGEGTKIKDKALMDTYTVPEWDLGIVPRAWEDPLLQETTQMIHDLVCTGEENFLFCWRKPWLLGWRRGIPGFTLNSLLAMLSLAQEIKPTTGVLEYWQQQKDNFSKLIKEFKSIYRGYLIKKRLYLAANIGYSSREPDTDLENMKKQLTVGSREDNVYINRLLKILQELLWLQIKNTNW